MRVFDERKHLARNCALSSLSVKYQWPEECALKFEISPSTHTEAKRPSRAMRTEFVSSDTLTGRFSASSNRAANNGCDIEKHGLRLCRRPTGLPLSFVQSHPEAYFPGQAPLVTTINDAVRS